MFPAQDFVPTGSFGNLIALPLHGASRKWAFLATLGRVPAASILSLAESVSMVAAGPDTRVYRAPRDPLRHPVPPEVHAAAGAMLSIDRIGMPPAVVAALKHLASLHNPEYYEKERLRLSTWRTPRFIRCYSETLGQLLLPRGLRDAVGDVLREAGSRLIVADGAAPAPSIDVRFAANLSPEQGRAVETVLAHELGVLVAPPGSGKTVVACAAIAQRALPTLVIVDRQPLVQQWRERLTEHLGLGRKQIGVIASGRAKPKGVIDIAMVQSLARRDDLAGLTAGYGHVVVDECHHVPATMFEKVVRQIAAPAWLGLTATPYRRDGLEGLITMYCGPVRHRMAPAPAEAFERALRVHPTAHTGSGPSFGEEPGPTSIQRVFRELVDDGDRTRRIAGDVAAAAGAGRNCLVLSQWTEHVSHLAASLTERGVQSLVLHGSLGRRARASVLQELGGLRPGDGKVLVATGSLLGEGFDCPALDTLFLAFPIAFKGRLVQYVGRVLRPLDGKLVVEVHDYVDADVPVLARMHGRRLPAYASLGFDVPAKQRAPRSGAT
jgi:superfamily II DNA or RNA helicase